jgi:FtsP/CotA-like multicopper oxidase with cupredoxin domain
VCAVWILASAAFFQGSIVGLGSHADAMVLRDSGLAAAPRVTAARVAKKPATKAKAKAKAKARSSKSTALSKAMGDALEMMKHRITPAMRQAAAARLTTKTTSIWTRSVAGLQIAATPTLDPLGHPDYFGTANYANSQLPTVDASGNVVPGTGIRKFVDSLPGLGYANRNNLGQFMPVAVPDTTTYPGSDYYEIELVQYQEKMGSDIPTTTLRGYRQTNTTDPNGSKPSYLGPMIIAQRDRPVRVKFTNKLPTGAGGDLFLPVDTSVMGAGMGPNGTTMYTQNRGGIHLHGGATPWISDGTPNQWTTPAGEVTSYPVGVSVYNVPDMPDPGPGSMTFFYTNQQSARLMFYHDHTYGLTRLNVYAGEAAGYLVQDPVEQTLVKGGTLGTMTVAPSTIPTEQIPLIIQDKTFVPNLAQLAAEDPTWDVAHWGSAGNLWFPHVYMPNQNPSDLSGANAFGRWDYGPWFWPPVTTLTHGVLANGDPGTPNPSLVPEAFMDTAVVNGTAYPYVKVGRKAYRLRILNASNDRSLNLQLYFASSNTPAAVGANGAPTLQTASGEVTMVPAVPHPSTSTTWPATWPTDGRDGGVPDPTAAGPKMIQIGTEGGILPAPVVLDNTPVGYSYNRRDITVLNVTNHTLLLGPAERADVIVDFSGVPDGSKIILYNDAPAPVPAFDPRYDYYTGDPDQTSTGGAPSTKPGYGPNTRTIMQFQVSGAAAPAFNVAALQQALPAAYKLSQDAPIIPEKVYGAATDTYSRIESNSVTFTPANATSTVTIGFQPKAIQELFELNYGRMNATLGVELPFTNFNTQTTIPLGYLDPLTEDINDSRGVTPYTLADGTQVWKITHNGVDTHAIHFHLFNVQVINRVGWDGAIKPPDPNEVGWKETVRMNPLEDVIVAFRAVSPTLPFKIGDSIRPLDPTQPLGAQLTVTDPTTGNALTETNVLANFGWEYVWHCHLLGHEENDMMRPVAFRVSPAPPSALTALSIAVPKSVKLLWTNNASLPAATNYYVQRSTNASFTANVSAFSIPVQTTFVDTTVQGGTYYYRVRAENINSFSTWTNTVSAVVSGTSTKTPTSLTISRGPSYTVLNGEPFRISGAITPPFAASVTIQYQRPGSTVWSTYRTVTTTASTGAYSFSTSTTVKGIWSFRAIYAGNATYLGSQSPVVTVQIL